MSQRSRRDVVQKRQMLHAFERAAGWLTQWRTSGGIVLLLDFDGTLAPIVDRPERAELTSSARCALEQLSRDSTVRIAIVSGRSLEDIRKRVGIPGIHYAGNHGMEVDGPSLSLTLPEALAARPLLAAAAERLAERLAAIPGAQLEDKGLTLTVHFRRASSEAEPGIREIVTGTVRGLAGLTITEGKKVLEIRPTIDWGKGEAVDLLLHRLQPPPGSATIYIGDDLTDEGAFQAVERVGDGVIVASAPPPETAATSFVQTPEQVGALLSLLEGECHRPA